MKSKQIVEAKQLFEEGKFEEVITSLNKIKKIQDLTDLERLTYHLLKSSVFMRFRIDKKCLKYSEIACRESQKLKQNLFLIDAILNKAWAILWLGNWKKANELIKKSEDILNSLTNLTMLEFQRKKAFILFMKASCYWFHANRNGLNYAERSLEIRKKLGIKFEIIESYSIVCAYYTHIKDDLDYVLKVLEKSQALAIEINHPWVYTYNSKSFGDIYYMKGDLKKALMYYKRGVNYCEELNELYPALITISEIGNIYREMGDISQSCDYLKYSYRIAKKNGNKWIKSEVIANLIEVLIINGDIQPAKMHLKELEEIYKALPNNKRIEQTYLLSKALILKSNLRFKSQAKAQEILKDIIDEEKIKNEYLIVALLNLCDLLLEELEITNNMEIIDEINQLIKKLIEITENLKSYWTLSETFVLQAKISLLKFDLMDARRLLTQAQKIAEKYQMNRLAAKISFQHDDLLQKLTMWKKLKNSDSSLAERMKLSDLKTQISSMIQKRRDQIPLIEEENPIILLISTEDGDPIFYHSFIQEETIPSHLIRGFLTSIDFFIREMFSEDLDRVMFGDYTLIMKSIKPFFIAYIFKDKSYHALRKLNYFIKNIKKDYEIWEDLIKNYHMNKEIHIKGKLLLKEIIKKTFLDRISISNNG